MCKRGTQMPSLRRDRGQPAVARTLSELWRAKRRHGASFDKLRTSRAESIEEELREQRTEDGGQKKEGLAAGWKWH